VKERGNKEFVALSERERERVLRDFEDTHEGDLWLTLVLGYTLEAYVGDPSYGGNPDEVVWRWLGHRPGFPRPPKQTEATRR
jgi:gluconate 2-dehydrogenase gamma chain